MRIRVLVIEEEGVLADSIVCGLREEGYSVQLAAGGYAARRALLTKHWDLVVIGGRLPNGADYDLLSAFRESDSVTPALVLNAPNPLAKRVLSLESADNYLCWPFDLESFLIRVRSLLCRRQAVGSTLRYADLVVDLDSQQVERARRIVNLTATEYRLLVCLLQNAEYVLSRTELYMDVWGDHPEVLSKRLEGHIKGLRRKLEAVGERLIQTVRGRGYKLQEIPPDMKADTERAAVSRKLVAPRGD